MLWGPMTFVKRSPCVLWRAGGQGQERQLDNCPMLSVFNYLQEGRYEGVQSFSRERLFKEQDT